MYEQLILSNNIFNRGQQQQQGDKSWNPKIKEVCGYVYIIDTAKDRSMYYI